VTHRVSFGIGFGGEAKPPEQKAKEGIKESSEKAEEKENKDARAIVSDEKVEFLNVSENSIINIYSIDGDLIKALEKTYIWDCRDLSGNLAPKGRYIFLIDKGKHIDRFTR
jgi:hypothetical protein